MLRTLILAPGLLALASLLAPPAAAQTPDHEEPAATAATEGAADHGDAGHSEPNILEPQIPLAFWTLIVFVLLFLLLRRFAWGPLSKALHDREHHMAETLQRAERARDEAEQLLAEHRKLMEQANQQAAGLLDEARRDAEANAERIRKTAQHEAESTLDRARREIESARDQALMDVWGRTADLAVSVAGKVLGRELQNDDHRRLIEVARSELSAAAAEGRSPVNTGSA